MIIYRPVRTDYVTQKYGDNKACVKVGKDGRIIRPYIVRNKNIDGTVPSGYVDFYSDVLGMRGHNGEDRAVFYGEPLYFPVVEHGMKWRVKNEVDQDGGVGVDIYSVGPVPGIGHVKFRFWHLKESLVSDGQIITAGHLIGRCDSTGASSGDHLHWAMKLVTEGGDTLNSNNGYTGALDFSGWYVNKFIGDIMMTENIQLKFIEILSAYLLLLKNIAAKSGIKVGSSISTHRMIEKLSVAARSRTVWTFVVFFVINGIEGVRDMIPANLLPAIDAVLLVLGSYFRVNAKAK